jgi:hypothetical protein
VATDVQATIASINRIALATAGKSLIEVLDAVALNK